MMLWPDAVYRILPLLKSVIEGDPDVKVELDVAQIVVTHPICDARGILFSHVCMHAPTLAGMEPGL